jgi:methionine-rich copper-binding protein CopC
MVRKIWPSMLALSVIGFLATPAGAHPTLKSANPPISGVAPTAPTEIRLSFSEGLIVKFCSVELKDQAGRAIATGRVSTDPKDQKQLVVPLQDPLPAGSYTVKWNVVSVDTHRVNGTYTFKVEP